MKRVKLAASARDERGQSSALRRSRCFVHGRQRILIVHYLVLPTHDTEEWINGNKREYLGKIETST